MADISDVENALVNLIAATLYPLGTSQPSATGLPTIVYPGWPQSSQLDVDMAAFANGGTGRIHVTVYPTPTEKNTTRYQRTYSVQTLVPATLALTVVGQQVTVSGTVMTPQNIALVVNDQPVLYAVKAIDTLNSIAAALAAMVSGATAQDAVITLLGTAHLSAANVGGSGSLSAMTKQQQRTVQITVWADTPAHRSSTASLIDSALSAVDFIPLADGTAGRLIYVASHIDDMTQKSNLYRRDLLYSVDYPTLNAISATEVVAAGLQFGVQMPDGTVQNETTTYQ